MPTGLVGVTPLLSVGPISVGPSSVEGSSVQVILGLSSCVQLMERGCKLGDVKGDSGGGERQGSGRGEVEKKRGEARRAKQRWRQLGGHAWESHRPVLRGFQVPEAVIKLAPLSCLLQRAVVLRCVLETPVGELVQVKFTTKCNLRASVRILSTPVLGIHIVTPSHSHLLFHPCSPPASPFPLSLPCLP